jgi:hypothetical protein
MFRPGSLVLLAVSAESGNDWWGGRIMQIFDDNAANTSRNHATPDGEGRISVSSAPAVAFLRQSGDGSICPPG